MSWANRATVEISAAGASTEFPDWFDVTRFVADDVDVAGWRVADGRTGALDTGAPARLDLTLRDGTYPPLFTALSDSFGRTVADGFGTADSGQLYTTFGTAADFDVISGVGTIAPSVLTFDYLAAVEVGYDTDTTAVFSFDALPATGVIRAGAHGRYSNSANHYTAQLWANPAGVGEIRIRRRVNNTQTNLLTVAYGATVSPGVAYALRLMVVGSHLRAKVWRYSSEAEPVAWAAVWEDRLLTGGSQAGVFVRDDSAAGGRTVSFSMVHCVDPWSAAGRFTPGNPNSPCYPWWGQSHRIRLYETYGPVRVDVFDGFVEWPEATVRLPEVDQSVSVTAVDRLGRLNNAPPFLSTLSAHIETDPLLVGYWPLADQSAPFQPRRSGGSIVPRKSQSFGSANVTDLVFPADTAGPPGDDVTLLRLAYPWSASSGPTSLAELIADLSVTVGSGQSIALSAWLRPTDSGAGVFESQSAMYLYGPGGAFLEIDNDRMALVRSTGYALYGDPVPTFDQTVQTDPLPVDVWRLVTVRLTLPAGTVDYWVGADTPADASGSGSPPASMTFAQLYIGEGLYGAVGYVQIRVGPTAMTHEQHLAQFAHGLEGLERQRTGQRVQTILNYAGVPAGVVDADDGSAVMSRARLAGKTPLTALREAETTEQGRLFTIGERIVFHGRKRRYDI